ncbi:response regulator [Vulgatibacter sp.]|uniref:response regulator n=1 Tax=Vulgatibacter sp. TaxID=1971226 RepID=UPI003565529A
MSGTEPTITALLIEDDDRLASLLAEYLGGHGVVVAREADGLRGQREALARPWDVILLDLMLPGRDGLTICREIRARSDVPIIVLTARGEEADRVMGLELGADDYLSKPFSPRELLARIRALLRRARGQAGPAQRTIEVGPLRLDPGAHRATLGGTELELTAYEFTLLRVFAERAGRVLAREQLLDLARGSAEEAFDRSIDVHVSRLRQKLGDDARHPRWLKTVRGVGYLFAAPEADTSDETR